MVNLTPEIILITASTVDVKIDFSGDYDTVRLLMIESGETFETDRMGQFSNIGINKVLFKKGNNIWQIEANFIEIYYLFYKDFYFQFEKDGKEVAKSFTFRIEPQGRKNLYGIVNKLLFDFNKLWSVSGTECYLFVKNPSSSKCTYCWDPDLGQTIATNCPHCDNGVVTEYVPIKFKARKIRTQSAQAVTSKGVEVNSTSMYSTFDRHNFLLETICFDITTREFLEIKNAQAASIGGVRTSTSLTVQLVDVNDDRVKKLIPLIP